MGVCGSKATDQAKSYKNISGAMDFTSDPEAENGEKNNIPDNMINKIEETKFNEMVRISQIGDDRKDS